MKPTKLLALALMLNILTDTTSDELGLRHSKFQKSCLIKGMPYQPFINTSDAIPKNNYEPLTYYINQSDPVKVKNIGEAILFTPDSSENHATLSSGALKPYEYKYVQSLVQFQNSDPNAQTKVLHILFYQRSENDFDNPFENVICTFCSVIGDSSKYGPLIEVLNKVGTFGSETTTTAASGLSSFDNIDNSPYYYIDATECSTGPMERKYNFLLIQSTFCTNINQTEFDRVKNLTQVMKMPSNLKRIDDTVTLKPDYVQKVLMQ